MLWYCSMSQWNYLHMSVALHVPFQGMPFSLILSTCMFAHLRDLCDTPANPKAEPTSKGIPAMPALKSSVYQRQLPDIYELLTNHHALQERERNSGHLLQALDCGDA